MTDRPAPADPAVVLSEDELTVEVEGGVVRGFQVADAVSWRGIPFGAPITGPRRWLGPQPVQPWEGVRDGSRFGAAPIQHLPPDAGRDEHVGEYCLTVNVTRRANTREGLKPVLVFLYGGSNANGRSSYSLFEGLPLVETEDIIFVTGNYRVGPFGFTDFSRYSTPEYPIEGNLALRDQLGILQWVQRNIEAFGGDPNDVTLSGQSAGALAVTTLMTVPAAQGLFHKAIAMSSPVACITSQERNDDRARRVVAQLGLDEADPAPGLFSRPLLEIYDAAQAALASEQEHTPGMLSYASVVDGDLLPEFPLTVLAQGRAHPVPLLIGTVLNEGTLFAGVNAPRLRPARCGPCCRSPIRCRPPGSPRHTPGSPRSSPPVRSSGTSCSGPRACRLPRGTRGWRRCGCTGTTTAPPPAPRPTCCPRTGWTCPRSSGSTPC